MRIVILLKNNIIYLSLSNPFLKIKKLSKRPLGKIRKIQTFIPSSRNCRYALIPQPYESRILRNFTAFAAQDLKTAKQRLSNEEFFKDFPSAELELDNLSEINDALKQHMFAAWLKDDTTKFNSLKSKFESLDVDEKQNIRGRQYLDPSKSEEVRKNFGDLMFDVDFNKTSKMHTIIPHDLKEALFDGWDNLGMNFVRILSHYGEKRIEFTVNFN